MRSRSSRSILAVAGLVAMGGCGGSAAPTSSSSASSQTSGPAGTSTTAPSSGSGVTTWAGVPTSATAIPLGDGHVSTTPRQGYVYSCTSQFNGRGATGADPWINTSAGTWNSTAKIHVAGANTWPNASHSFTRSGSNRVLATDDLPAGATTGNFPIAANDPAYQYDRNPNHITAQSDSWTVPADPVAAGSPACLGLGPIGVSTDGVLIFDALDAVGRDAGAHEMQDSCAGHPQEQGAYHYHTYSPCLGASDQAGSSTLVGYALDGFGIYAERDGKGDLPSNADLDACHGRTSAVMWDGTRVVMYHYDVTLEYPYTLGCFHGSPATGSPGS